MRSAPNIAALAIAVGGCSTTHQASPPAEWRLSASPASACQSLTGRYWDQGIPSPSNKHPSYRPLLSIQFNVLSDRRVDPDLKSNPASRWISVGFLSDTAANKGCGVQAILRDRSTLRRR